MSRTRSLPLRVKRALVLVHLWFGLTLGLIWAVQGLTGALLVFHREADQAALSAPPPGALRLDTLVAAAARTQNFPPESIGLYFADPGRPNVLGVFFAASDGGKKTVLVSTSTGAVLADRHRMPKRPNGNLARWLYNLHHYLLLGENGGLLIGASGLFLLSAALSGMWLGWPRRGQWRAAFAVRNWRTRLQRLFGWHRAGGLLVALALVLLALSGAAMSFGKQLREIVPQFVAYRLPYLVEPAALPKRSIGADKAVAIAQQALPQGQFVSVGLPSVNSAAYQVRFRTPGEWRAWSGTSVVTVAPENGRVLDVYDAARAPLANRVLESAFAVHSGEVAGTFGRVLVMLAGLSLPALYITGLWAWLRKRRLRRPPSMLAGAASDVWQPAVCSRSGGATHFCEPPHHRSAEGHKNMPTVRSHVGLARSQAD